MYKLWTFAEAGRFSFLARGRFIKNSVSGGAFSTEKSDFLKVAHEDWQVPGMNQST